MHLMRICVYTKLIQSSINVACQVSFLINTFYNNVDGNVSLASQTFLFINLSVMLITIATNLSESILRSRVLLDVELASEISTNLPSRRMFSKEVNNNVPRSQSVVLNYSDSYGTRKGEEEGSLEGGVELVENPMRLLSNKSIDGGGAVETSQINLNGSKSNKMEQNLTNKAKINKRGSFIMNRLEELSRRQQELDLKHNQLQESSDRDTVEQSFLTSVSDPNLTAPIGRGELTSALSALEERLAVTLKAHTDQQLDATMLILEKRLTKMISDTLSAQPPAVAGMLPTVAASDSSSVSSTSVANLIARQVLSTVRDQLSTNSPENNHNNPKIDE